MNEHIFISKNLKPWVKNDVEAMNLAYNECWKQKEKLEKENERLKAERDLLNEAFLLSYNHLCDFIFACKNRKNMPMDSFINDIIKEAEHTAETNPLFIQEFNKDLTTEQGESDE